MSVALLDHLLAHVVSTSQETQSVLGNAPLTREDRNMRCGHGKPSFPLGIPPGQVLACSVQRRRVGGLVSRRSVPFLSPHSGPATHCCVLAPTPIGSSGPGLESPGPLPCPAVTSAPSPRRSFTPRGIDMSLSEQTPASPRGQEVGKGRLKRV